MIWKEGFVVNRILDRKPVNISRQSEFDYLKGFFMVFIFLVHAYQATLSNEDIVTKVVYGFAKFYEEIVQNMQEVSW